MRTTLTLRHFKKNKIVQTHFDDQVDRLLGRLSNFKEEAVFIHATVDKNPHKDHFSCSVTVHLPSMTLHAHDDQYDLFKAMNAAFSSLVRQAEKFKARLRKDYKNKYSEKNRRITEEQEE